MLNLKKILYHKDEIEKICFQNKSKKTINEIIYDKFNFENFFSNKKEINQFEVFLSSLRYNFPKIMRYNQEVEWGSVQTPENLVLEVYEILKKEKFQPTIVIEPTFGVGNFLHSIKNFFPSIKLVYGIELNIQFKWLAFLQIATDKLISENPNENKIKHNYITWNLQKGDIFSHDFSNLIDKISNEQTILIIGNPPWVTTTELSKIQSKNIPKKSNFQQLQGLDAITGKSNFDISENIIRKLITNFQKFSGKIAMLCKFSVAKKIVEDQKFFDHELSKMRIYYFEAKKYFNKVCDACLFIGDFGEIDKKVQCNVYSLNKPLRKKYTMGWLGDKFITNLEKYNFIKDLDKKCTFEWRQGVKHDCSKVMILYELAKNTYKNNMGEKWKLETELLYPFLKSSDLQQFAYDGTTNRRILITQKRLGMETNYIQTNYPKTWKYLQNHKKLLAKRKSKIYQNQPPFSLFGIGAYAFSPYKVAIASMYKEAQFILLTQMEQKPIMLDDTCYYLSFENYSTALFTNSILNTPIVKEFLSAITSHRKQRVYTKSILSRIGLEALIQKISYQDIKNIWTKEKFKPKLNNPEKAYEIFRQKILNKEH